MNDVDTEQTITSVEWFYGYGGNHLGLRRILPGLRCVAACEIEAYAVANMVAKMEAGFLDAFPVWSDVKTFPCEMFRGLVDIFIASYPCQGFSTAGKRAGVKDPRFLWPWVLRAIVLVQPRHCFFENVAGHVSLGLSTVLSDLAEAGYKAEAGIFSAAECGAPQQRKRVFILAQHTESGKSRGRLADGNGERRDVQQIGRRQDKAAIVQGGEASMDNASGERTNAIQFQRQRNGIEQAGEEQAVARSVREREPDNEECAEPRNDAWQNFGGRSDGSIHWPGFVARPGEAQHGWETPRVIETERGLGGGVDGRSANVDRLRLLGNGVYPECAARAFVHLAAKLGINLEMIAR